MCRITATELKENLGKYLELSLTEEVLVTKNGKPYTRIFGFGSSTWDELTGILDENDLDLSDPKTAGILKKLWECWLIQMFF